MDSDELVKWHCWEEPNPSMDLKGIAQKQLMFLYVDLKSLQAIVPLPSFPLPKIIYVKLELEISILYMWKSG